MTDLPVRKQPFRRLITALFHHVPGPPPPQPAPPDARRADPVAHRYPAGTGAVHPLSARQYRVLQAVADGRVRRDVLLGSLEPHLLDGRDVIWTLRALVLRGLMRLQPIGPPLLTRRGKRVLDSPE